MDVGTLLLLLAGSVAAVVPVAIAIAAYKGVFGSVRRHSAMDSTVTSQVSQETNKQVQKQTVIEGQTDEASSQPIQEAPAPFPEDSVTPSLTTTQTVPTDISAISRMSSIAASAAPVLVIATPKKRTRSAGRRLPSTSTASIPRKRRSTKRIATEIPKTVSPSTTSPEAPTSSDPSAQQEV